MSSIAYSTTSYGTSAAATLTIPMGAATPGNPAYEPASLTVKKGDAIEVVNEDSVPHTVTSGTGLEDPNAGQMFDTSIIPNQDPTELRQQDYELVTATLEPGEYDFHCTVHPFMTGKLKVVEEQPLPQQQPKLGDNKDTTAFGQAQEEKRFQDMTYAEVLGTVTNATQNGIDVGNIMANCGTQMGIEYNDLELAEQCISFVQDFNIMIQDLFQKHNRTVAEFNYDWSEYENYPYSNMSIPAPYTEEQPSSA